MKKYFQLLAVALLVSAVACKPQGSQKEDAPAQSHKRVVHVQGHPHELLTKKAAEGTWQHPDLQPPIKGTTDNINPGDVECWAGYPNTSLEIDSAYLLVKFTDGKREDGDSILLWGYRFNPSQNKTSLDMLRAVANADQRFVVLLQNASSQFGYTVGGFGYNYAACARVPLYFELEKAKGDGSIAFHYVAPPNTSMGQAVVPLDPQAQANAAITTANSTGIIEHPFNINYGYPAYDYDWWLLTDPGNQDYEWQAGWNHAGYWNFYTKDQLNGPFNYSSVGVSSRVLKNNFVDGFVFGINFASVDMSGDYTPAICPCSE